jgi:hypothetical protein
MWVCGMILVCVFYVGDGRNSLLLIASYSQEERVFRMSDNNGEIY